MHVLMTSDTLNGNIWTYTRELISGLIGRGMRVTRKNIAPRQGRAPGASPAAFRKSNYSRLVSFDAVVHGKSRQACIVGSVG